jgi:hypothetical protein
MGLSPCGGTAKLYGQSIYRFYGHARNISHPILYYENQVGQGSGDYDYRSVAVGGMEWIGCRFERVCR